MAVSQFDPYRQDILLYKEAGMSAADMIRALEADHGIEVKRSSFYLYCKTLFAQERAAPPRTCRKRCWWTASCRAHRGK